MSDLERQDSLDMARLAGGHYRSLNDLMGRHGEKLFRYLVRSLQSEADAADLAQETFVRVYQNRKKYDDGKKFTVWLYAIASNLVRDCFRRRSRHPQVSLDAENSITGDAFGELLTEDNPLPSETVQARERNAAVRRAVAALPIQLRLPLILAEYEEMSQAEIGKVLCCSAKAVETRIHRARQRLRVSLCQLLEKT